MTSLSSYKFRGVPKPFEHQVETTQFIVDNPRCFVFNDIGTGKTWSAVWAIDYLMKLGEVKNVLIVAPLSTLQIVWWRTFFHLDAGLDVQILKGTAEQRKRILDRPITLSVNKVSIINPEGLCIIADEKAIEDYDMILVDESALFRNSKATRTKKLTEICSKIKRVVMMTGSPCPEAPTDIWSTARIVCPDRVPKFFGPFRDKTMRKINMFKWVALPNAQEKIAEALKGYTIRFNRDECIDLPEVQHHVIEVEPSKEQVRMIREMRKAAVTMYEDDTVSAPNEAVVISKILQIASGAVRFHDGDNRGVIDVDCKSKLSALEEVLEASTQPVIVFAPYRAAIDRIAAFFSGKIPYSVVTGDTRPQDRMDAFDALQSGMIRMLIAHPQAMSHGITLTNSNVVVWWCPVYSHEICEQANGRITRPGQIRNQYVIHLVCSALEKRVIDKLESKSILQGTLLEYMQRRED
jgi:SNF2 family DNA or RNA helicase